MVSCKNQNSSYRGEFWVRETKFSSSLREFELSEFELGRFSYDLEMKTREQNRNNNRMEIERFDWFIERIQTLMAFGWLSESSGEKNFMPENFLEINRCFALTSYCHTIGQSINAFSILGFSLARKRRGHVLIFSSMADKTNIMNTYRNHFSRSYENRSNQCKWKWLKSGVKCKWNGIFT